MWWKVAANKLPQGSGTQLIQTYLDIRQATVAEWMAIRHIFDVCAMETVHKRGGNPRVPWRRFTEAEK